MEIESQLTKTKYMKLLLLLVIRGWSFNISFFLGLFFFLYTLKSDLSIVWPIGWLIGYLLLNSVVILRLGLLYKKRKEFLRTSYVFNDEDISITSPISEKVVKWEAITKWQKLAGYYLFHQKGTSFFAIEKSSIPAEQVDIFEWMLKSKIINT